MAWMLWRPLLERIEVAGGVDCCCFITATSVPWGNLITVAGEYVTHRAPL
jgi:hypothetical protein